MHNVKITHYLNIQTKIYSRKRTYHRVPLNLNVYANFLVKSMHLRKFHRIFPKIPTKCRLLSTQPGQVEEYTETPEYPPIKSLDRKTRRESISQEWSQQIQSLKTVEEKQMKLNMPKYYGWKTIMLNDQLIPYDSMRFVQHCTRTHFRQIPGLPDFYNTIDVDSVIPELKTAIEECLLFEYEGTIRNPDIHNEELDKATLENLISDSIIQQINRIVLNYLSAPHLSNIQIDLNPRHEAFWFIGGTDPPANAKRSREKLKWTKDYADEPINRAIQYIGKPSVTVRTPLPLEPIIPYTDIDNPDFDIPLYKFDPRVLGINSTNRHGTNIPGFWPGDRNEFGLVSFQSRGHVHNRLHAFGEDDHQEALHSHGIMSSFAWLLAQASYQGFTAYNDLTYPLVAQTVVTNGKEWSFYTYQLNTVLMHSDFITTNAKRNICWGTPVLRLFESIDENGKIVGFNEDVLKKLVKFYSNVPKERVGVDMKPYLGKNERVVAEISDEEKKVWLENQYKHMMTNRPRHRELHEVYHWEKIYKIDNETRMMEPRRRPFELGINPWKRKYGDRSPTYIPKAVRPGGPKSRNKFEKNYYP